MVVGLCPQQILAGFQAERGAPLLAEEIQALAVTSAPSGHCGKEPVTRAVFPSLAF